MQIYVGNIPYNKTAEELGSLFSQYGEVAKVTYITDRETGRFRGFGFVEMPSAEAGAEAIEALEGTDFGGRNLKVNEARPRQARAPRDSW